MSANTEDGGPGDQGPFEAGVSQDDLAGLAHAARRARARAASRTTGGRAAAIVVAALVAAGAAAVWVLVATEAVEPQPPAPKARPSSRGSADACLPPSHTEPSSPDLPASSPSTQRAQRATEELGRQRRAAAGLMDKARKAEAAGDLLEAQSLLLQVLNDHDPQAWPDGAEEALRRVQAAIQAPVDPPVFFNRPHQPSGG